MKIKILFNNSNYKRNLINNFRNNHLLEDENQILRNNLEKIN